MMVLAIVDGKPYTEQPTDLFIPPDALEVLLDSFSGPLDLLLYLIRRQNFDILDIPIAHVTQQYMQYIQLLEKHRLELAADYLVMAAMLAEIKSRLLLPPVPENAEELEEDPRMVLVKKLQLYEQFKDASEWLDTLPRVERDTFRFSIKPEQMIEKILLEPTVELSSLIMAMKELIKRESQMMSHQITKEPLSIRDRMVKILDRLNHEHVISLTTLFSQKEGRRGLVVTFLAMLELARQSMVLIVQSSPYASVYIHRVEHG